MEQAAKAITSDVGGEKQSAQGLGSAAEFGDKDPEVRVVDAPEAGVVESPPSMAKAIIDGDKRLLVKAKPVPIAAGEYTLLSVGKALGVVKLGERVEIDAVKFAELEPEHLITEQLRGEWSEVQPSWAEGPWYGWPVEVVQKFDEPRSTNVEPGPRTLVLDLVVEDVEVQKIIWSSPAGKARIAKRIASMLPEHSTYVEPFVGSGAVLFAKQPAKTEVVNDADPEIAEAFKNLKGLSSEQIEQLKKKNWTGDKSTFGTLAKAKFKDVVGKLHRFLYLSRFSYGKMRASFAPDAQGKVSGAAQRVEKLASRLKGVVVMNGDYQKAVTKYDGKDTAFFLDPPYPGYDAHVGEGKFEEDRFLELLKGIKGKFLVTYGIRGKLPGMLKDTDFKVKRIKPARSYSKVHSVGGAKQLQQLVIMNYEPVSKAELGDGLVVEDVDLDALQVDEQVPVVKQLQLAPDTNVELLTKAELEQAHWQLHGLFDELAVSKAEGWDTESVVNLHALVVEKMADHPAPPDNGLDELSGDFEAGADERPRWHEAPAPVPEFEPDEVDPISKAASDPYLEAPPEDKPYRFTAQQHWRGKSMHADIRLSLKRGQLMIGWTLNTQIKDVVKEPVTTLAEAKRWSRGENAGKVSKINWATGEWASRSGAGADKPVRVEILAERKTAGPHSWLDVEGKTKDPEPGKAPPVGGTQQYPGVFDIVDRGAVEYGAQKPWFHEYYFQGGALNYRMFFRLLKVSKRTEPSTCEVCGAPEGVVDMGWGDADSAVCCTGCTTEFLAKASAVLPPSDEQGTPEGNAWLAIYPEDQTPYVLGPEAVKKGWMPPDGRSALPAAIRSQVPAQYRYWGKRGSEARTMRDELVAAVKAGEVKLDYEAPYKTTKATQQGADFVLQKQTAEGGGDARWWVRMDTGQRELLVLQLQDDPLESETVKARVQRDRNKASMDLEGSITAGHYLNRAKASPSSIEAVDRGKAEVLQVTEDLVQIRFKGEQLKGLFDVKRNDGKWLWAPGEEDTPTTKSLDFQLPIPFHHVEVQKGKGGTEKRLVTGIVLEPDEVDAQNDWERIDTIERAAHSFLRNYNKPEDDGGTQLGYMHKQFDDIGIDLVESWIAPTDFQLGGKGKEKKVKRGSWLMTVHVHNDKKWREVKDGKLTGFSVGGTATVAGK